MSRLASVVVLVGTTALAGPRLGDEHAFLEPGLAVQVRATASDTASTPAVVGELRRLRWSLRSSVADGFFLAAVQLQTTPTALELVDLWADVGPTPWLRVRAGQFKVPFTRWRQLRFSALAMTEWDPAAGRVADREATAGGVERRGSAGPLRW